MYLFHAFRLGLPFAFSGVVSLSQSRHRAPRGGSGSDRASASVNVMVVTFGVAIVGCLFPLKKGGGPVLAPPRVGLLCYACGCAALLSGSALRFASRYWIMSSMS